MRPGHRRSVGRLVHDYDETFGLHLNASQVNDLVEYLKSL